MGNFFTPWVDGVTSWEAASLNPALAELDRAITYHKLTLVGCDGTVSWSTGTLTWSGKLHIYFTSTAGLAIHNEVATGSIALSDSEFAYVTLSETNNATITVSKAAIGTGATSVFKAYNVLVLGYRNAADDGFYPEELAGVFAQALAGGAYVEKATYNAHSILAATTDNTPAVLTVGEQTLVGRITGGNIAALTPAQVVTLLASAAMAAGQQEITSASAVTINWSAGSTAYMTFANASVAVTFSNPVAGQVYRLLAVQNAGNQVFTWTTTIKWRGGSAPTLSTAASARDILTFVYINGAWYGDISAAFA